MTESNVVVGIDLGTTNSEIAALTEGQVRVLGPRGLKILPSCVGLSPSGELLVGQAARNQSLVYPERTVRSIKRRMGTNETVTLGDRTFTPPEISALILRELVESATRTLGQSVDRAVITVPAYFSDAQRNATREAGQLAGLEVLRILNEPTAASLAYGFGQGERHTALVYDLGGGTFDVSVVTVERDVTEVLASHGNNRLGGDDFDELLAAHLTNHFESRYKISLKEHPAARARLWWAAEEAKKALSFEPFVSIREEALVVEDGKPLHLSLEIAREEYEAMIRPLVESTLLNVSQALDDARKRSSDLDSILLVGGATRTPMVSRLLIERTGLQPRQDVHPDLCVALGAGVLASRLAGHDVDRVLLDISPYSFGPSYLGMRDGYPYEHCYRPIIARNTPLPATRTERYFTVQPFQKAVELEIYQGDDEDALKNILVGDFRIEGLQQVEEDNEVLCRMSLDLDGILHVTAIEKSTGKSKHVTIDNALKVKTETELAEARRRLQALYASRSSDFDAMDVVDDVDDDDPVVAIGPDSGKQSEQANVDEGDEAGAAGQQARSLVERSRGVLEHMHPEDVEEAIDLHEKIGRALAELDEEGLKQATEALKELLFFVEGR